MRKNKNACKMLVGKDLDRDERRALRLAFKGV
jgi:hypothetical protein